MDSAGEPTLPFLLLSVDAKMQAASWKVRIISTTTAWPGVVLLLSCETGGGAATAGGHGRKSVG
uniref:Uncharacterized protein n=1 Tax=Gallus gallus TaxID=9031 RepID=A0A8V1A3S1_CHICK